MRIASCQKCGKQPALVLGSDSRYNATFHHVCCSYKTVERLSKEQSITEWNLAQMNFKENKTFPKLAPKTPVLPIPDAFKPVLAAIKSCTDPERLEAVKEYAREIESQFLIKAVDERFRELEPLAHVANMMDILTRT